LEQSKETSKESAIFIHTEPDIEETIGDNYIDQFIEDRSNLTT